MRFIIRFHNLRYDFVIYTLKTVNNYTHILLIML
nr:MAG TPA: hypothetical protein [Inoviridae sp.]